MHFQQSGELEEGHGWRQAAHAQKSAEMFYLLDGRLDILSRDQTVMAEAGDVIVVPLKSITSSRRAC
jgi:ethanolamine utilization protein EutQ (cupin superfamily)